MTGKRTRRRFTAEFKAQAVRRVLEEGGVPLSGVVTELGVFASLNVEHVHQARHRTRDEARAALFDRLEVSTIVSAPIQARAAEARAAVGEVRARMAA